MPELELFGLGALAVALAFGGALTVGGAGLARHLDREARPVALGAVVALAVAVVVATDVASVAGFRSSTMVALATAVLAAGWLVPARHSVARARPASDRLVPAVLAGTAVALGAPLLLLPVPFDTDAQGFGHLALSIRDGGTIDTLAPWRPDIAYLYAPGALLVFATLSELTRGVPMSAVMFGASHVAAFFFVWLARDLGAELGRWIDRPTASGAGGDPSTPRRYARVMLVCAALSLGLWTALMDAHYTALLALLFALAYLTALFRCLRTGRASDVVVVTLTLAAVVVTHPDTTMIVGLGLAALLALGGWRRTARVQGGS